MRIVCSGIQPFNAEMHSHPWTFTFSLSQLDNRRGGQANFFKSLKIANQPVFGLIPLSQILKFLRYASPQIENPHLFLLKHQSQIASCTKYCTTLSQPRRKSLHLRTCGSFKSTNHKKDWVRKSQTRRVSYLRRSANLINYLSPQTCGYAICESCLRAAHL
jgi:hypothetical protein